MLCFSSLQPDAESHPESHCTDDSAGLADSSMVLTTITTMCSPTCTATEEGACDTTRTQSGTDTPSLQENAAGSLPTIRESLGKEGISMRAQEVIM